MDQQFESDVMHDLGSDSPSASADEAFELESFNDGFEGDGFEEDGMAENAMLDGLDQYGDEAEAYGAEAFTAEEDFNDGFEEHFNDNFAETEQNGGDALESAVANAMEAEDGDEFLLRLISGIRGVAGTARQNIPTASRPVGPRSRPNPRRAARPVGGTMAGGGLGGLLQQLLPLLRQHAALGADEAELFEDLADWYEQEQADQALPVLAGVAARAALRPLLRRGGAAAARAAARQIVRGATQAARTLIQRQGPRAVRALGPIGRSVGRAAQRNNLRPAALPGAIRQTAARVAAQPALAQRLIQPRQAIVRPGTPRNRLTLSGGVPRRFLVQGPVEIIIRS